MHTQKGFIGGWAYNLRFVDSIFKGDDVIFVCRDCQIFVENNFVEHVVLEIVGGAVEVHDFEDRIAWKDEQILVLFHKYLSNIDERMRVDFLCDFGPACQWYSVYLVAGEE